MPIYAYRCDRCGHDFDRLQRLADPDPETCPECGAVGGVKRQLTAPSFRLAGSGWYETDFKKDGDKKRNLVEKGDGGGKGDGGDKSAGDKPADKATGDKPAPKAEPAPEKAAPAKTENAPSKAPKPPPSSD